MQTGPRKTQGPSGHKDTAPRKNLAMIHPVTNPNDQVTDRCYTPGRPTLFILAGISLSDCHTLIDTARVWAAGITAAGLDMITNIEITNFKSFGGQLSSVWLAPVTLLYGPNSTGKSSINRALRLIQSHAGLTGRVDHYSELVYRHDLERDIVVKIEVAAAGHPEAFEELFGHEPKSFSYQFNFSQSRPKGSGSLVGVSIWVGTEQRFELNVPAGTCALKWYPGPLEEKLYERARELRNYQGIFEEFLGQLNAKYNEAAYRLVRDPDSEEYGIQLPEGSSEKVLSVNKSKVIRPVVEAGLAALDQVLTRELAKLRYIGPQRKDPREPLQLHEVLDEIDATQDYVGERGQLLTDILSDNHEILQKANEWLGSTRRAMGCNLEKAEDPKKNRPSKHQATKRRGRRLLSGQRWVRRKPAASSSYPVPAGLRLYSSNRAPEFHLHPRLQAGIRDLAASAIGAPYGHQFISETHSENPLLRIMRRMREGRAGKLPEGITALSPEDISIRYVEEYENWSVAQSMSLNQDCELIKAWPSGFFEEGLEDVFA